MVALTELELPYLAVEEPSFAENPAARFAEARRHHPWLAKAAFGHVMTEFLAIREFMQHEDKMRMPHADMVAMLGASDTPWGRFLVNSIQSQSGAAHQRLRAILAAAFTPAQANIHRGLMREVITRVLDDWVDKGAFDFEEFASYFPITVMCRIIGASPDVLPSLRSSLETLGLGASMDPAHLPAFQKAIATMEAFVRELVAERRAEHRSESVDLLDKLLEVSRNGELSDDELFNLLIFLFTAGYDTSKNVLTLVMYVLLGRSQDYERCADDLGFCRKIINETLRYYGVASLPRVVSERFEFRGIDLPVGSMILLPWGMVGRDPGAIEDPDVFDPERPGGSKHIAFGLGSHICLGQFIARAQIEEGLHLIAQRIRKPRLAGEVGWRSFAGVWGIQGLPIAFEPR